MDERFTSKMAVQTMIAGGVKKKDRQNKALIDAISATIILQSYLDNLKLKNNVKIIITKCQIIDNDLSDCSIWFTHTAKGCQRKLTANTPNLKP